MLRFTLIAVCLVAVAPVALAQPARISPKASYGDAVVCYQYYSVAKELARKLEADERTPADAAAAFELQALTAGRSLVLWSNHLGKAAGKRTQVQIDADVKAMGAPVIADANAALKGDKAAAKRGTERGKTCEGFEAAAGP
jgi:hypothetical protein